MGCHVGVIEGPNSVTNATIDAVERELAARNSGLWLSARAFILIYFDDHFQVLVTIPNVDPFEPSRLNRIFDVVEHVITTHIPNDIPVRDDTDSWSVTIQTEGDDALIDGISGGHRLASRTERLSDDVGVGTRTSMDRPNGTDDDDAANPLWEFLSDRAVLEELIAEGAAMRVSSPILCSAVSRGDIDLVRLLLKAGGKAVIDDFDRDLAWTPLMHAARKGDVAMVTFLLDAGSNVNAHDETKIGDTALMLAVQHGHDDTAKVLVQHGADPAIPGWMGLTPLDHAQKRKRMPELYELLKSAQKPGRPP